MVYIAIIILLALVDQLSKYKIDNWLVEGETHPVIGGFLHLTYVKNRGIAFGIFQGKLDIISIITVIVIVGVGIYFFKNRKTFSIFEKLGYSFILGGAIGNIIDRIFRGFVVDMIDFRGIWVFVFNLADVWINIGVILIIIDSLLENKRKKKK
ncbi:signal peptidase II [uncultured Cetobacterium sp.]|uniref:signal peptidase II n=1 Tax=uncultured Cetobacterium sp. TaxID=527638 RepID=UPI00260234A5|nr:signal peptidase II [uncultured Cetobacterium sp.]